VVWRLLLGQLPPDLRGWRGAAEASRGAYWAFVRELVDGSPDEEMQSPELGALKSTAEPAVGEPAEAGPLSDLLSKTALDSASPDSDVFLLHEILKDVNRTFPDLSFFIAPPHSLPRLLSLSRLLFVWSKLNKGTRYVQGMNEIAGVVFYTLAAGEEETGLDAVCRLEPGPPAAADPSDPPPRPPLSRAQAAEADAYFLTSSLLSSMVDVFTPSLDDDETGIAGRISAVMSLVRLHDPSLADHLASLQVEGQFFLMRWITTLLSREFHLPDVVRLWDSLLASVNRDNFLRYACATMVFTVREELLEADFSGALEILQNYPVSFLGAGGGGRGECKEERGFDDDI
jgi:hypothetical protein